MMERLFPNDWDFGGEERRKAEQETAKVKAALSAKLDPEGAALLERLSDAFTRSSNFEIRDAFTQGVCDGMELMLEFYGRQRPS